MIALDLGGNVGGISFNKDTFMSLFIILYHVILATTYIIGLIPGIGIKF